MQAVCRMIALSPLAGVAHFLAEHPPRKRRLIMRAGPLDARAQTHARGITVFEPIDGTEDVNH